MPTVDDRSVDVVFSGQNIEHLWADDLFGFLCESARVLRPGGTLVVDSPNRLATDTLGWVHPEHTIELTADEASQLFVEAGFEIEVVRGLWNCRDQRRHDWLPLIPPAGDVRQILDRATTRAAVDDSFVWWIEARRSDRVCDPEALRSRVSELFRLHWNHRVNRAATCVGEPDSSGGWTLAPGAVGSLYRTQPFPLFAGSYEIAASHDELVVRLMRADGSEIHRGTGVIGGQVDQTHFGVTVELTTDAPLTEHVVAPRVTVDAVPSPTR
jgi:hypothetical protein